MNRFQDYWEKLLRHHYEQEREVESQQLGKGKRARRQVNYASEQMQPDWTSLTTGNEEDYDDSFSEGSAQSNASGDEEFDNARDERRRKRGDEK